MLIKDIRAKTGLTQKDFSVAYHIPLQTLKQWESSPDSSSYRTPPEYVIYMIDRLVTQDYSSQLEISSATGEVGKSEKAQRRNFGGKRVDANNRSDTGSDTEKDSPHRLNREENLIFAAKRSRYNARHWFRYLRKEIGEGKEKLNDEQLKRLLRCDKLTMFQKITLKRAMILDTPTNRHIVELNMPAKTGMVDELRRKYRHV